jgi:hypothetical protein
MTTEAEPIPILAYVAIYARPVFSASGGAPNWERMARIVLARTQQDAKDYLYRTVPMGTWRFLHLMTDRAQYRPHKGLPALDGYICDGVPYGIASHTMTNDQYQSWACVATGVHDEDHARDPSFTTIELH